MQGIITGNLGYVPIPKVACTSIKHALFTAAHDRRFVPREDHTGHIHNYFEDRTCSIAKCPIRTVVIRDPVKRLISAYSNRVVYHRDLSPNSVADYCTKENGRLPPLKPNIGEFVDDLEAYTAVPSILHHTSPFADIIQNELYEFTHIFPIEQVTQFVSLVEVNLQKKVVLPKLQTEGPKLHLSVLSATQLEKLIEYYRRDYELLGDFYSIDAIWKQFKAAN